MSRQPRSGVQRCFLSIWDLQYADCFVSFYFHKVGRQDIVAKVLYDPIFIQEHHRRGAQGETLAYFDEVADGNTEAHDWAGVRTVESKHVSGASGQRPVGQNTRRKDGMLSWRKTVLIIYIYRGRITLKLPLARKAPLEWL